MDFSPWKTRYLLIQIFRHFYVKCLWLVGQCCWKFQCFALTFIFQNFVQFEMQCFTHFDIFVYMNTCWAPHLEMSPKRFTMATIVLSFLRLHSSRMWHWMSTQCILNIHLPGYSTVWLLYGWCHLKLLLSWCKFCVRHRTMHQFLMSPYSEPHMQDACMFSCDLPPVLLAEWPWSFTCHCSNMGVEWILTYELVQTVDPGEDNSPAASAGTWTQDLPISSL